MGCENSTLYSKDTGYPIENEIRKWENTIGFQLKIFSDLVFEINTKTYMGKEEISIEKFNNFFLNNLENYKAKDLFQHSYFLNESNNIDTMKVKKALFLLCNPKKIVINGSKYFYDKASYLLNESNQTNENSSKITPQSNGLFEFIKELSYISLVVIPELAFKSTVDVDKYKDVIISNVDSVKSKIDKISEAIIGHLFSNNRDTESYSLSELSEIYEFDKGFLSSGYIRNFVLDMFS